MRYQTGLRATTEGKTGVLLVNLGTPEAATAPSVRRYLGEFLHDHRVVELDALDLVALSCTASYFGYAPEKVPPPTPKSGETTAHH